MTDHALTQADACVLNAAALLTGMVVFDPDRQKLLLETLAETVNRANWGNPKMGPLLDAVRALLDLHPTFTRPVRRHYGAEVRAIENAVEHVFWWRLGHALERQRQSFHSIGSAA